MEAKLLAMNSERNTPWRCTLERLLNVAPDREQCVLQKGMAMQVRNLPVFVITLLMIAQPRYCHTQTLLRDNLRLAFPQSGSLQPSNTEHSGAELRLTGTAQWGSTRRPLPISAHEKFATFLPGKEFKSVLLLENVGADPTPIIFRPVLLLPVGEVPLTRSPCRHIAALRST
jgi:hypothetical protein